MTGNTYNSGTYPTMITPYTDNGVIDWEAVENLVEWYWKKGCDGIFASCQSSEIWFLSEDERVQLAEVVKRTADRLAQTDASRAPMTVVASGHTSDNLDDQVRELTRIAETGVDSVILITNRFDTANGRDGTPSDENWIREAEYVLDRLPKDVMFGLYECPVPYKRMLTPKILQWCLSTGRFRFIKDTCCDADEIERRMQILRGTELLLFNANAQTLLPSLKAGAAGYCGVMANFHPELYVWLVKHWANSKMAEEIAEFLCLTAFTESLAYPCTAKFYHRALGGVPMSLYTKSRNPADLTDYHKMCVQMMASAANRMMERIKDANCNSKLQ